MGWIELTSTSIYGILNDAWMTRYFCSNDKIIIFHFHVKFEWNLISFFVLTTIKALHRSICSLFPPLNLPLTRRQAQRFLFILHISYIILVNIITGQPGSPWNLYPEIIHYSHFKRLVYFIPWCAVMSFLHHLLVVCTSKFRNLTSP